MTVIAGVFDTEANMDDVLKAIYSHDIDAEHVTIMRDAGAPGDGAVERSDETGLPIIPTALYAQTDGPTGGLSVLPVVVTDILDDVDLSDEEMHYYHEAADEGAAVVFVEVEDDHQAEQVTDTMKANNATRVVRHD